MGALLLIGYGIFLETNLRNVLLTLYNRLLENPSPLIASATAIFAAYMGIRTQRKLARFKNSVDFQSNCLSKESAKESLEKVCRIAYNGNRTAEIAKLKGKTSKDEPILKDLMEVLNNFERMAIGIDIKVYDENILFRSYAQTIIDLWNCYSPLVKDLQNRVPVAYTCLERLSLRWTLRRGANLNSLQKGQLQGEILRLDALLKKQNKN